MNYCILRAEKLTSFGSIAGSAKHTFREIPTPNADASRTHLNWTGGAKSSAAVRAAIEARLPAKRRKDAVLCIEYLITASPEWCKATPWKTQRAYFNAAIAWLRERHGTDNVVCLNLQLDEASPHLVAYAVPLTKDGRLSAKDFLGGRKLLTEMQTEFADQVGKSAGLQRGVQGCKAIHTTAKQYNAAMLKNPTLKAPVPPVPTLAARITGKAIEEEEKYKQDLAEYVAQVEQAQNVAMVAKKNRLAQMQAIAAAREEAKELQPLRDDKARLENINEELADKLMKQRKYYLKVIEELKTKLNKAIQKIDNLLKQVDFLNEKIEFSTEKEKLRLSLKLQYQVDIKSKLSP